MPNFKIEKTADDSLVVTARIGDVTRWQSVLKKESDEFVHIAGKRYEYDDVLAIYQQESLDRDTSGGFILPMTFYESLHKPESS